MSSKGNPILPSEPLSLQPNLIAAAVLAECAEQPSDDSHSQLSPRSASKVRRRMDIRHFGRSESRGPSPEERSGRYRGGRTPDAPADMSPDHLRQQRGNSGGYHERNHSPGDHRFDRRERRSYSPRQADDRDTKRFRIVGTAESAADDAADDVYYAPNRSNGEGPKGDPTPSRVLGIFGMSKFTNEAYLRSIFDRYGPIERIQIIRDPHEGRSRGYAFVNMRNVDDAQRARNDLTGTMIHDRKVRVDFSITSRAHPSTPGKYKGQETGSSAVGGGNYQHSDRNAGYRYQGGGYRGRDPLPPHGRPYRDQGAAPYRMRRRANTRDRRRTDSYNQHHHHHHQQAPYRGGGSQLRGGRSRSPGYYNSGPARGSYDSYRGPSYHEGGQRAMPPPPPPPPQRDYDDRRIRNSRSPPGGRYGYSRNSQPHSPSFGGGGGGRHGGFGGPYPNRHYGQDHQRESIPNNGTNGHRY
ncbi:transformer 2 beta [Coemansia sp. IMI 209127]|nr:transformer 2 beta [Coemansia sp. IMI 209127]